METTNKSLIEITAPHLVHMLGKSEEDTYFEQNGRWGRHNEEWDEEEVND